MSISLRLPGRPKMRSPAEVYTEMARNHAAEVDRLEPELRAMRTIRDAAIRKANVAGVTIHELAKVTGLSRAQVQRICDLSKVREER